MQRRAGERGLARQHLVHHAAEREEVAAAVHVVAGRLFGAHVRGRADGQADLGEGRAGGRRGDQRLADAEVGHDRVAFVQQDVLGLDVAMDDVVAVRVVERVGHLDSDAQRLVDRHGGAVREAVTQRLPLHHRHDEIQEAARFTGVVEGQDVRMVQACGELDLPEKALAAERLREVGPQHLDRDVAAVLQVVGEVDRRHAALAELAVEAIVRGQGFGECSGGGHRGIVRPAGAGRQRGRCGVQPPGCRLCPAAAGAAAIRRAAYVAVETRVTGGCADSRSDPTRLRAVP